MATQIQAVRNHVASSLNSKQTGNFPRINPVFSFGLVSAWHYQGKAECLQIHLKILPQFNKIVLKLRS